MLFHPLDRLRRQFFVGPAIQQIFFATGVALEQLGEFTRPLVAHVVKVDRHSELEQLLAKQPVLAK